jgi:phenylacetate-CoA ligase
VNARSELELGQLGRLRDLMRALLPANAFYAAKLGGAYDGAEVSSLEDYVRRVPFTIKQEIADDQRAHPPYGTNLTFPLARYTRFHQTSGTTGRPLRWLDTDESWEAMLEGWMEVFRAAGVGVGDRILFAFTFGPFIGFWMAFEAARRLGCLCLPGGGLTSAARLRMMLENDVTVLCCTPTYAARLAEVAVEEAIQLADTQVRVMVVAGEPGGSVPGVRARLERLWGRARVFDHHGMTEVGTGDV